MEDIVDQINLIKDELKKKDAKIKELEITIEIKNKLISSIINKNK